MTTLAPPATSAAAPWRAQFLQQLSKMPMPLCAVSTLHPTSDARSAAGAQPATFPTIATPRVRSCVCRGLWGSLPENAKNPAPRNPAVYESDLPVFTTDARMDKAWELAASAPSASASSSTKAELGKAATIMTGGGGPVEAVWWASESGTQWRVRGTAWVLGPDIDEPAAQAARYAIEKQMRRTAGTPDAAAADWSWPREITAHFGNMSPGMRGSFRNPAPGLPRPRRGEEGNTQPGEGMGAPVDNEHLDDPEARANFRVVVIVPAEVDQVDLSSGTDPRRWVYTYVGEDGQDGLGEGVEMINGWAKQEVWP